jgi:hypothetical protein
MIITDAGRVCVCCGARNEPLGMLGYSTLPACVDREACAKRVANNEIRKRLEGLAALKTSEGRER